MFNSNKNKIVDKPKPESNNSERLKRPIIDNVKKPQSKAVISKDCIIKGEISGNDDMSIFGKIEGTVTLKNSVVTIEKSAMVKANLFAKNVNINGNITGNIEASNKIIITDSGNVTGDMTAPKIILKDGSYFKGNISMVDTKVSTTNIKKSLIL